MGWPFKFGRKYMNNQIKIGVVGCGILGAKSGAKLQVPPGVGNLKMMCDLNENRLKHFGPSIPRLKGPRIMIIFSTAPVSMRL